MFGIFLKLFSLAFAVIMIVYLLASVFRNARGLDRRIREFKAEQEAEESRAGSRDPYAAMASLYTEETPKRTDAADPDPKRRRR